MFTSQRKQQDRLLMESISKFGCDFGFLNLSWVTDYKISCNITEYKNISKFKLGGNEIILNIYKFNYETYL